MTDTVEEAIQTIKSDAHVANRTNRKTKDKPKPEFTDLGTLKAEPYFSGIAEAELETVQTVDLGPLTIQQHGPEFYNAVQCGFHRLYPDVKLPGHKTKYAGCFDIETYLGPEILSVKAYDYQNREYILKVQDNSTGRYIALPYGNRALIPTGLIFELPRGFALSLLPRSSTGLKKGLQLSQSLGYVDEDYRNEVFLPVTNTSHAGVRIDHCERLFQGYLHPWFHAIFNESSERPGAVTDRTGGFGSTN